MGPPGPQQQNVSSVRYHSADNGHPPQTITRHTSSQRNTNSNNVTSADSSDIDEDNGELPAAGLVAPLEVLRGLAEVATERAEKVQLPFPAVT